VVSEHLCEVRQSNWDSFVQFDLSGAREEAFSNASPSEQLGQVFTHANSMLIKFVNCVGVSRPFAVNNAGDYAGDVPFAFVEATLNSEVPTHEGDKGEVSVVMNLKSRVSKRILSHQKTECSGCLLEKVLG
jgi:hypothetical protein